MDRLVAILRAMAAFAVATAAMCVVNFIAQIAMIFLDVLTRLESSSTAIVALWFVTGVFTTVFAVGDLEQPPGQARLRALVVLVASAAAVVASIVAACLGCPGGDPLEFSLLFTNVWVVIAFYVGTGAMAFVFRLGMTPAQKPASTR